MDLEHDERLIAAHGHQGPLVLTVASVGLSGLLAWGVHPSLLLLAPLVLLAVLLTAIWTYRRVLVTDRRVVEFRPALAAIARRLPRLVGLEVRRRRVIDIDHVIDARPVGTTLVLRTPGLEEHHIHVHDERVAFRLGLEISDLARERKLAFARRRPVSVRVAEAASAAAPLRCPYCHDALREDEPDAAACAGCGARHHAECFEIHRGCSASGCGARTLRPRAREQA